VPNAQQGIWSCCPTHWRSPARSEFRRVGEIGLDFFGDSPDAVARNISTRLSSDWPQWSLPVVVHVRRSADRLLKYLRRIEVPGASRTRSNGSEHQAPSSSLWAFGSDRRLATFNGSLRIPQSCNARAGVGHRAGDDAPDIAPQWLTARPIDPQRAGAAPAPSRLPNRGSFRSISPENWPASTGATS